MAPVAGEPVPAGDDPRDSTSIESGTVDVVFVVVVTLRTNQRPVNWLSANGTHCMCKASSRADRDAMALRLPHYGGRRRGNSFTEFQARRATSFHLETNARAAKRANQVMLGSVGERPDAGACVG